MQETYLYTFGSVIIISLISFSGLFALSIKEQILRKYIFVLVSLATGALFGDAFIHLIPGSFEKIKNGSFVGILVILGIIIFFILEKYLHWHHHEDDELKTHHTGKMVLISDGLHNLIDGMVIAVSFLAGTEIGIATTLAVILHEIPQEIGDFGILLNSGYTIKRALFLNFLSAILAILGSMVALLIYGASENIIQFLIPVAAGGFIYIAGSDLVPELHKTKNIRHSFIQLIAIIFGVVAMILLLLTE